MTVSCLHTHTHRRGNLKSSQPHGVSGNCHEEHQAHTKCAGACNVRLSATTNGAASQGGHWRDSGRTTARLQRLGGRAARGRRGGEGGERWEGKQLSGGRKSIAHHQRNGSTVQGFTTGTPAQVPRAGSTLPCHVPSWAHPSGYSYRHTKLYFNFTPFTVIALNTPVILLNIT